MRELPSFIQSGYCSTFVEPKWKKSLERKQKREHLEQLSKKRSDLEKSKISDLSTGHKQLGSILGNRENSDSNNESDNYVPPDAKKGKYDADYNELREIYDISAPGSSKGMPNKYRHVRESERKVREEIYSVMHLMSSKLHMSKRQIEGSIIAVANIVFDMDWKPFQPKGVQDLNTLPSMRNSLHTEPLLEAMALNAIVQEMMEEENTSSITYSNDGSSMNGVGSFVVQSLTINGVQRTLPTLGIFTESRESLKDLEITTLKILPAATGHKYSE